MLSSYHLQGSVLNTICYLHTQVIKAGRKAYFDKLKCYDYTRLIILAPPSFLCQSLQRQQNEYYNK